MSAPSTRVQPVKRPTLPAKTTPEIRYWRGYRNTLLVKESNAINHIHFSPGSPHNFAVTSSTRVQIFSAKTRQVTKTIARFKDTVYSGEFRPDGKLLVAGDATGLVQVFDVNSRSILVTLQPTSFATHVTKFHPTSFSTVLSASDDRVARLWDLTSPTPVAQFKDHDDYIRTATFLPQTNLVATGCYDGMVRIFDSRAANERPASVLEQHDPVESVVALNSNTIVAAAGPVVRVWDTTAGKIIKQVSNFQKTVTCVADAGDHGLLAGSLDGHVKVFDTKSNNWDVKFGWKYGGAVLSTGISPDAKHMTVGLTSGLLSIRTRKTAPKVAQGVKTAKSGNFARMIRGAEYHGEAEHMVIDDKQLRSQKKKLKNYEKQLQAFRWSDALDSAFANGLNPQTTITILEELKKRGKVRVSLLGRDEDSLEPIMNWALKAVQDTRSMPAVADWIGAIIDIYGGLIDQSDILQDLVGQLQQRLAREIGKAKESQKIEGMLELLINRA